MGKALEKLKETLYERDFYAWLNDQAKKLRARSHNDIDWDNLAEEIESVGRSEKHEIRNRMRVLLQHLLKWEFQPGERSHSWQSSISEQRTHILGIIEDSPSLKGHPAEVLQWSYRAAIPLAALETKLKPDIFPSFCVYSIEEILDGGFMPGSPWHPDDLIKG